MAFVDHATQTNRKTAIIGVTAIHALLGTALVTGLAGGIFNPEERKSLDATTFRTPPPPPPPKPEDPVETPKPQAPLTYVPPAPMPLNNSEPAFNTAPTLPEFAETTMTALPPGPTTIQPVPRPTPKPLPSFSPIVAKPSNNPGSWVQTNDYRSSWINREWTGTATFKVSVGTNGKVQNCQIVASTGHSALDEATCDLVTKRARFEPARDSSGNKTTGDYSTSVKWQLPR